jgi:hypothetical protein
MGLETQPRPRARHVLVVAAPQDAQANELVNALRESGLNVILANTELLASQADEVGACILVLHPELWHETPAITAALQHHSPYMIPVLTEEMALPEGSWATKPISLKEPISETAQELATHITDYFHSLPEEIDETDEADTTSSQAEIHEQHREILSPTQLANKRGLTATVGCVTTFLIFLAITLTIALPTFFLTRHEADQTMYKSMKIDDSLLTHPYTAVVPGSACDRGGARWGVGQYFKAPTTTTSAQGTPAAQAVFDDSTEMACKPEGLQITKKDHFNYYATVVFEDRDQNALPQHFKTQITAAIGSSSSQASVELGVRMQKPGKDGNYNSGYGNNTFTVKENGQWEVRRISNTSSAVEATLASGSVQPAKIFTLSAEANGPLMIFAINGTTVSTVIDTTYQNSHGISFGIADPAAKSPLSALFSDFSYTPLTDTHQSTAELKATATAQANKNQHKP